MMAKKKKAAPKKRPAKKKAAPKKPVASKFDTELVHVSTLQPHPRNYRKHPEDQLAHIVASIKEHGFYRNVVATTDGTILAGHGVVQAATAMKLKELPVIRLNIDPESPQALKLLTGDNEISNLADIDDRMLTTMLKQINDSGDLAGTGFDEQMLAALVMVTRPTSEIEDFDAAAEWVGMPEYEAEAAEAHKLILNFRSLDERTAFIEEQCGAQKGIEYKKGPISMWYPERTNDDLQSVEFAAADG